MKILIVVLLILPSLLLTGAIWVLGGWTKGWDYMPNPTYALIDWVMR
jgi:hypothetical protein